MPAAPLIHQLLGHPDVVDVDAWDGSRAGPPSAPATLIVRSPDAVARLLGRPGELGVARAWVAGDLDVDGDLELALEALHGMAARPVPLGPVLGLARAAGRPALRRLPPPPEEAHPRGRRHSLSRDREAVTHHYDVSNEFYRLLLGPSLTYSCAVWDEGTETVDEAQANKHELVCAKLGLTDGDRLLDIGCGWGSTVLHAAEHHGAVAVGITLSPAQAELARARVAAAHLDGKVEIRVADHRQTHDGPFDAVCSVGMFEHVGQAGAESYATGLHELVRPGGRVLHHAIDRPADRYGDTTPARWRRRVRQVRDALGSDVATRIDSDFMRRYVFPDAELFELGHSVERLQAAGLEVRHVESLREHYARTLRAWSANLAARWDEAVALVGPGRARVWRLYLAASALGFDRGDISVHQVLAVRPTSGGDSELPLRPWW